MTLILKYYSIILLLNYYFTYNINAQSPTPSCPDGQLYNVTTGYY